MKTILKVLPLAVFAAACAHTPGMKGADPEPIVARGSAAIDASGPAAAREKAVQEAQRSALLRTAGLFMGEEARAGSVQELEAALLKAPQLYVAKWKVLSEASDGGLYRVEARVWMSLDKLYSTLRAMKLAGPATSSPLAAFSLRGTGLKPFSAAFSESFSRSSQLRLVELPAPGPGDDDGLPGMLDAAEQLKANLLFVFDVSVAASGGALDTGFIASTAEAALTVYGVETAEEEFSLSSQANAIDSSQAVSFSKSLSSAGELLAQKTAARTTRYSSGGAAPLKIKVSGLSSLDVAEKVRDQLQRADVSGLWAESYSDDAVVFAALPLRSDPYELASSILRTDAFGLELEGVGPGEISFSLMR